MMVVEIEFYISDAMMPPHGSLLWCVKHVP